MDAPTVAEEEWTPSTTSVEVESEAQPVISALDSMEGNLSFDDWPKVDETNVKRVVETSATVIGDLEALASENDSSQDLMNASFAKDDCSFNEALTVVRRELRLAGVAGVSGDVTRGASLPSTSYKGGAP